MSLHALTPLKAVCGHEQPLLIVVKRLFYNLERKLDAAVEGRDSLHSETSEYKCRMGRPALNKDGCVFKQGCRVLVFLLTGGKPTTINTPVGG